MPRDRTEYFKKRNRAADYSGQKKWHKANPLKIAANLAIGRARKRAAAKSIPFNLPLGTVKKLVDDSAGMCALSGLPFQRGEGHSTTWSPSLDRIKPELGYVSGNVRLILHGLNALKSTGTDEDLMAVCRAVVERNK